MRTLALLWRLAACDTDDPAADDTDVPAVDPCAPDPCADAPGTVCEAGRCVGWVVTAASEDGQWTGSVGPADGGPGWTFSGRVEGSGAVAMIASDGGGAVEVTLTDAATVEVSVDGARLGGVGALDAEGEQALAALQADPELLEGLARVPLELGCGEVALEAPVRAALLAPWQAVLKYGVADRRGEVRRAAADSRCAWFELPGEGAARLPPGGGLLLGIEAPIPVVHGFLPFDAAGAAAQAALRAAGDPWGPCGARCRGTCGIDCPSINCGTQAVTACEQAATGGNTGAKYEAEQLDCGTATGCVNHDDCYDTCNATFGCGSWDSVTCRHGSGGCDEVACLTHGADTCASWAAGLGPYEGRIGYLYARAGTVPVVDTATCPVLDTTLQWEVTPPSTGVADAYAAVAYCEGLTAHGRSDWRLPSIDELQQIEAGCPIRVCDTEYGLPFCGICATGQGPRSDGCYLEPRLGGPCGTYWSSTLYEEGPIERRWVWSPLNGVEYVNGSTYAGYFARCVAP